MSAVTLDGAVENISGSIVAALSGMMGDKVEFDLTLTGGAGEVTAIHKQP